MYLNGAKAKSNAVELVTVYGSNRSEWHIVRCFWINYFDILRRTVRDLVFVENDTPIQNPDKEYRFGRWHGIRRAAVDKKSQMAEGL